MHSFSQKKLRKTKFARSEQNFEKVLNFTWVRKLVKDQKGNSQKGQNRKLGKTPLLEIGKCNYCNYS